MGDVLAIVNWELDATIGTPPDAPADWTPYYGPGAAAFLTDFTTSPQKTPSLQYRDADTGALLAVHPYSETPDFRPGGYNGNQADIAYGPGASAITSEFLYLCGWEGGTIWKLRTSTAETVWRVDGFQHADPSPPLEAFANSPVLSPDGTLLYVTNDASWPDFVALDTTDASVVSTVTPIGSRVPSNYGAVLAPDGTVIFACNDGPAAVNGLYKLDLTTGTVTPFLMLTTLGLSYSSGYLHCYQIAPHPSGDGFAFTVQRHDTAYHSELVECAWDGTVTQTYNYAASSLDGERLAMFFAVCYSSDGTKLYAVGDTSWSIIWNFERGPGSVGGATPWMHCDFLNQADWVAAGSPPDYDHTGLYELWESTISGVGVYRSGRLPLRQFQRAAAPRLGRNAPRLPGPNQYR